MAISRSPGAPRAEDKDLNLRPWRPHCPYLGRTEGGWGSLGQASPGAEAVGGLCLQARGRYRRKENGAGFYCVSVAPGTRQDVCIFLLVQLLRRPLDLNVIFSAGGGLEMDPDSLPLLPQTDGGPAPACESEWTQ